MKKKLKGQTDLQQEDSDRLAQTLGKEHGDQQLCETHQNFDF